MELTSSSAASNGFVKTVRTPACRIFCSQSKVAKCHEFVVSSIFWLKENFTSLAKVSDCSRVRQTRLSARVHPRLVRGDSLFAFFLPSLSPRLQPSQSQCLSAAVPVAAGAALNQPLTATGLVADAENLLVDWFLPELIHHNDICRLHHSCNFNQHKSSTAR